MNIKDGTIDLLLKEEIINELIGIKTRKDASILRIHEEIKKEPALSDFFRLCFREIFKDKDLGSTEEIAVSLKYFVYGFYLAFKAFMKQMDANKMKNEDLEAESVYLKNYISFLEKENSELSNGNKE